MKLKNFGSLLLLAFALDVVVGFPQEQWSWSSKGKTDQVTSLPEAQESLSPTGDNATESSDREARFLGLGDKLCVLGIGHKCKPKPNPHRIDSHYGPPALPSKGSSPLTSSYATLSYDGIGGHGYPSASPAVPTASKGSVGGLSTFFVAPKPYPSHIPSKAPSKIPIGTHHSGSVAHKPLNTHQISQQHHINPSSVIHHVHTHTHVHQNVGGVAVSSLGGPAGTTIVHPPVSSGIRPSGVFENSGNANGFLPSIHPVPVSPIPPTPNFPGPIIEAESPPYPEECQCVPAAHCALSDVVPRRNSLDIRNLIDARSRRTDILSNATDVNNEEPLIVSDDDIEPLISIDSESNVGSIGNNTNTLLEGEQSRRKRDLLTSIVPPSEEYAAPVQERQISIHAPGALGCSAGHVCCKKQAYRPPRLQYTCGRSNAAGILGRVKNPAFIDGDAEFAEYPWQAAIIKREQGDTVYVCGAALISDRHLLTAAHCIKSIQASLLEVRLGEWDVSTTAEFYQHINVRVASVVVHPEYYAGNLQNDIAIITLQNVIDFTQNPHISPACLPEKYDNFVGHRCHSTGWGKDAFGKGGKFQSILKEVEVPIVSNLQCQTALRHTHLGATFSLPQGNICAGGEEGRDTCKGDGGGPLVCSSPNGSAKLVGLVSWGIGCGKVGIPGVYVDVSHYLDWIRASL